MVGSVAGLSPHCRNIYISLTIFPDGPHQSFTLMASIGGEGQKHEPIKHRRNNMNKPLLIAALTLGACALTAVAQDEGRPPRPDGQRDGRRPPPPIVAVLDANHDGVIDADEIANAPAALKKLDKNGDGKLTHDELRPPRDPEGERGKEGGRNGPPPGE
jgi:hypothetical protein